MRALHDGPDHDAGAAILARDLRHGRIPDREIGRATEHGRECLGIAARGADLHVEAVLLEDAGMHADVEIDVAEVMHGLAEAHRLQTGRKGQTRAEQRRCGETSGDGG